MKSLLFFHFQNPSLISCCFHHRKAAILAQLDFTAPILLRLLFPAPSENIRREAVDRPDALAVLPVSRALIPVHLLLTVTLDPIHS